MLKILLSIVLLLVLAVVSLFFYKAHKSKTGVAPGLTAGQLTQCPASPNCVCSEHSEDSDHFTQPIPVSDATASADFAAVKAAVAELGGNLVEEKDDYFAATFESGFFGFVDDFEARLDTAAGVIHVRSASRVGHSDLGANLKRIDALKSAL